jgi:hypothetical protein
MLYEHELGRNFVKGMEEGVKEENKAKVVENARGIYSYYRSISTKKTIYSIRWLMRY